MKPIVRSFATAARAASVCTLLAAATVAACAAPQSPPPARTPTAPIAAETSLSSAPPTFSDGADARVNGITLHYLTAGKGTPIVLLHGYAETSHMWLPLLPLLSKQHAVIAPDLRGAGASDKPAGGYDKKTMAADIHALVRSLGYTHAQIVGHDIGLMVAYAYAAQYPTEVDTLTLMDAFLPGVGKWQDVWLMRDKWHFHFYGETPERLVAGRERIFLDHFWNDFAADRTRSIAEDDRRYYSAVYAQPGAVRAGMEWFRAFEQDGKDFEVMARTKLTMPVMAMGGEKASGAFLVEQARLVATSVQAVILPGAGHWLMEEAPQPTMSRLVAFLEGGNAPPKVVLLR
jgi:pimeloyl-ACP methyl ester carboxylesterase